MKHRMPALALALFFLGSSSLFAQAIIKFEKSSHNFGTFKEKDAQTYVFKFTNTGDEPLVVQQVFTSCGCVARSFTKEPVLPGKSGEIKVTYNGKGRRAGEFEKSITIRTNTKAQIHRLKIKGSMIEDN